MDFTFTDEQLRFRDSVRHILSKEVTPEVIRASWDTESGRSETLWEQLAQLGLTAMLAPENCGGLGLDEIDFVLIAEECGYAALPEPLIENSLVAIPLLAALEDKEFITEWLTRIVNGEARVAVNHSENIFSADAHIADLILSNNDDEIHLTPPDQVQLVPEPSVDPSRRIFKVVWSPTAATCIVTGAEGVKLWEDSFNRGALGAAAQCLGASQRMIEQAVQYTSVRKQFGRPVGSFQAVKHHLADAALKLEFAKAPVYRAAASLTADDPLASIHVSQAKISAGEAALLAARNCMQVHGAMGYTWELDLQIWLKRAWVLDKTWGSVAFHKQRLAGYIFAPDTITGAGQTFTNQLGFRNNITSNRSS